MISALIVAVALAAAQAPDEPDCRDPQAQIEMNICAQLDFEAADRELNAAWPEAIANARAADREIDRQYDRRATQEAKMREAQRAWLIFRDAQCTVEGFDEARGGSMEPMVYGACRARLTRERTAQLRALPEN